VKKFGPKVLYLTSFKIALLLPSVNVKFFLCFLFPGKNQDPLLVPKLSLGAQLGPKLCFGNGTDMLRNHICETTCSTWQPEYKPEKTTMPMTTENRKQKTENRV